jgi:molybdate transport repressor ModE-like protein
LTGGTASILPHRTVDGADFDWSLCRTFLAVVRGGSIQAAALDLGISHPAVRRQLARLEESFGAPLLSRSQAGTALTPLGAALLRSAEAMESAARAMASQASSSELIGTVRIATDDLMVREVLPAAIASLRVANPGAYEP